MFWIETSDDTAQFPSKPGLEEVGGKPTEEYASTHGDAEGLEYFL